MREEEEEEEEEGRLSKQHQLEQEKAQLKREHHKAKQGINQHEQAAVGCWDSSQSEAKIRSWSWQTGFKFSR